MAEIRTLEDKLNNLLKHLAYPCFRVSRIVQAPNDTDSENEDGCDICVELKDPKLNILRPVVHYDKGMEMREFISRVRNCKELKPYTQAIVRDVTLDEGGSLSLDNVPKSFIITGLPYRQMKISIGSEDSYYIDLCQASYQRVCAAMSNIVNFPAVIPFSKIKDCLKRKEVLVLLITLSQ